MSFPRTLAAATVIGVWLMFSPTVFDLSITTAAADVGHLCGALIVTVSVISMGEVVRIGRYLNVLLGLIVAVTPWFLDTSAAGYSIHKGIIPLTQETSNDR